MIESFFGLQNLVQTTNATKNFTKRFCLQRNAWTQAVMYTMYNKSRIGECVCVCVCMHGPFNFVHNSKWKPGFFLWNILTYVGNKALHVSAQTLIKSYTTIDTISMHTPSVTNKTQNNQNKCNMATKSNRG